MQLRTYDAERDRDAVIRIWREVGWISSTEGEKGLETFLSAGRAYVAEMSGSAECMVNTCEGQLRYFDQDIPLSCITGVTTSHVAKKQQFASRLLAHALREAAEEGAEAAALGIFDQGFYDRLGFGTGAYEHWCTFDPAQLQVPLTPRPPARFTREDCSRIHANRLSRHRVHGTISVVPEEMTQAEMIWSDHGLGLGYTDETGALTHHVWLSSKDPEGGPFRVNWLAFRTAEQLLELLGLIRNLGDQATAVRMQEVAGIQLQDLLVKPFRNRRLTRQGKNQQTMSATAYVQYRMLDLASCIRRMCIEAPISFNLVLEDPIVASLEEGGGWSGIGGEYTIRLDRFSTLEAGLTDGLPTLRASVGAFSRLWLGVLPASKLAWTDRLDGPESLLEALDEIRLPKPTSDWEF